MNGHRKLRPRPGRDAAGRAPAASTGSRTGTSPLPYERAEEVARRLVAAASLDDGGKRLGELAGAVSLDPRIAGTVVAALAHAVATLSSQLAEVPD